MPDARPLLYVVACAAPPTHDIPVILPELQRLGWAIRLVTTPDAIPFLPADIAADLDVSSAHRRPDEPRPRPPDALIAAPVTFNSLNKWAAGIADNLALGILAETIGSPDVPVVVVPWAKEALARHPAFQASIRLLRTMKATVVWDRHAGTPDEPLRPLRVPEFPWRSAIAALPQLRQRAMT